MTLVAGLPKLSALPSRCRARARGGVLSIPGTQCIKNNRPTYTGKSSADKCLCRSIGTSVGEEWNDGDYVEVGTLVRPHGIRGEIVVTVDTSFPEQRFGVPGHRYIQAPSTPGALIPRAPEPPRIVELVKGRQHIARGAKVWLLTFKGINDRDAAEELKNYRLLIHKDERDELEDEDEFYTEQLIGMTVVMAPLHPAVPPAPGSAPLPAPTAQAALDQPTDSRSPGDTAADSSDPLAAFQAAQNGQKDNGGLLEPESQLTESELGGQVEEGGESVAAKLAAAEAEQGQVGEEEEVLQDGEIESIGEEGLLVLGQVVDSHDGTGTHGVLRVQFEEGLYLGPDGVLVEPPTSSSGDGSGNGSGKGGSSTERKPRTGLLPFVKEIVPVVDPEANIIIADPPEGWLELYVKPKPKRRRRKHLKRRPYKLEPVPVIAGKHT